ncbi:MAG: FAD-binding oxidoreductase [Armatimonadetes bacterium]|nr:FAD-binding oxidoreductase [Armatimonadota bacterium]
MKKIGARFVPETVEELSELVRETGGPVVFGVGDSVGEGWPTSLRTLVREAGRQAIRYQLGEFDPWNPGNEQLIEPYIDFTCIDLRELDGVFELDPADQVARVGTATHIYPLARSKEGEADRYLQPILAKHGQCLPFPKTFASDLTDFALNGGNTLVGRGLALNFPHSLQTQCGSWRDWVLGMTVVLADGTIVKTGSKAVKSVAGYDVHKLMIGAYDTLGIVVDVNLRTFPLKALPEPDLTWGNAQEKFKGELVPGKYVWRQRVLRSHYQAALAGAGDNLLYADNAGCTLWCWLDSPDQDLPRYPGDWVVRTGCGEKNVQIADPTQIRFMKRAKAIFDPEGKLNPGEFGFL